MFFVQVVANKIGRTKPIKIIAPVFGKNFKFPSKKKKIKSTLFEGWSSADLSRIQQFTCLRKNQKLFSSVLLGRYKFICVRNFLWKILFQIPNPVWPQLNQHISYARHFRKKHFEISLINIGVVFFSRCSCWHFCTQSPGHLSKGWFGLYEFFS